MPPANGSPRGSSPVSRGSASPRSTFRAEGVGRHRRGQRAVQRRDRRRAVDQSARPDDRRQPRRRGYPRARRAGARARAFSPARARLSTPAPTCTRSPRRGNSSSSSSARPARTRPAARAPRRTSCSAMRCAKRRSCGATPPLGRRVELRRARAPGHPQPERIAGLWPDARRSEDVLLTRFDAAALVPVLQGRQYLLVHVERASDILQVLELKREFPSLKIVHRRRERRLDGRRRASPAPAFR